MKKISQKTLKNIIQSVDTELNKAKLLMDEKPVNNKKVIRTLFRIINHILTPIVTPQSTDYKEELIEEISDMIEI